LLADGDFGRNGDFHGIQPGIDVHFEFGPARAQLDAVSGSQPYLSLDSVMVDERAIAAAQIGERQGEWIAAGHRQFGVVAAHHFIPRGIEMDGAAFFSAEDHFNEGFDRKLLNFGVGSEVADDDALFHFT
jgi:hypothetical protein